MAKIKGARFIGDNSNDHFKDYAGGNDYVNGKGGDDTFYGNVGNDILEGGSGEDELFGGRDNDTIDGGSGNDVIIGGYGDDTLSGGYGNDVFNQSDLSLWFHRNTDGTMQAVWSDDTPGNDYINGNQGNNTLLYGNTQSTTDTTLGREVNRFAVNVNMVTGTTIKGTFGQDIFKNIQNVTGTDLADTIMGDAAKNVLIGGDGNDVVSGGAGDDVLYGDYQAPSYYGALNYGSGSDTLNGGQGNDTMIGGLGDDTYLIERGDGQDKIIEHAYVAGLEKNTIKYGQNIALTDLSIKASGNDVVVAIKGTTDQVTLVNWNKGVLFQGMQIVTATGALTSGQITALSKGQQLLQATAAFGAPATSAQTTLSVKASSAVAAVSLLASSH